MNESFIHHVLRVALILGVLAGLAGFGLLLYAADFWSSPAKPNRDQPSVAAGEEAPPLEASRDFGERAVIWMFGEPDAVVAPAPAEAAVPDTVLEPVGEVTAEPEPAPAQDTAPPPEAVPEVAPEPEPQFELRP